MARASDWPWAAPRCSSPIRFAGPRILLLCPSPRLRSGWMPFVNQEDARRLRQTVGRVDQLPPEEWGQDQTDEGAPGPPAATLDVFEYVKATGAALASGVAPGLVTIWDEATGAFVDRT